jgi:hypothetical protein
MIESVFKKLISSIEQKSSIIIRSFTKRAKKGKLKRLPLSVRPLIKHKNQNILSILLKVLSSEK